MTPCSLPHALDYLAAFHFTHFASSFAIVPCRIRHLPVRHIRRHGQLGVVFRDPALRVLSIGSAGCLADPGPGCVKVKSLPRVDPALLGFHAFTAPAKEAMEYGPERRRAIGLPGSSGSVRAMARQNPSRFASEGFHHLRKGRNTAKIT